MDPNLKAAAQKELLKRRARAELERRRNASPDGGGFDRFRQLMTAGQMIPPSYDIGRNFQILDDTVRTAANGASFGTADRLAGYMNETGTEAERARSEEAKERLGPVMAPVAEIGGSMLPAAKLMQMGVTATRIPQAGKYLGGALDGTAFGAAQAAGYGGDVEQGAKAGFLFGGAGQGAGKLIGKAMKGKGKIPTQKELEALKNTAYRAVDDSGITYQPERLSDLTTGIEDSLQAGGIDDVFHPKATRANQIVKDKLSGPQSLTQLDKLRQFIRDNVVDPPGMPQNEGRFSGMIQDNIDEFIDSQGNGPVIEAARKANQKFRKTEQIATALTKAEHRAGRTGSGGNIDNTTRQNISAILDNPKKSRGFTPDEKALMEKITMGTRGQNAARQVGKLSPSGNGLQQALALGATAYNPVMAAFPAVGMVSKFIADRGTKKLVRELMDTVAVGGKTADVAALKTLSPKAKSIVDALARALMVGGTSASMERQN